MVVRFGTVLLLKERSTLYFSMGRVILCFSWIIVSLCVSFVAVGKLILFLFPFVYLGLIVSLSVSFVSLSFCLSTETKSIWQFVRFLHFTGIF
jgi:apolipoprotein N-acyltransferase